jgi:acetyl-CoA carboxylase biotin carboxyl carrier protein
VTPNRDRKGNYGMTDGERLEAIRRLLSLADAYGLAELEVEEDGLKILIRGAEMAAASESPRPDAASGTPSIDASAAERQRFHALLSPMTGVFYRSAGPDAPPFVEPEDLVEEGQAIGIIEAMKVFSEIPADRAGRIVEILAPDGQLVSQDDPLMLLDPED